MLLSPLTTQEAVLSSPIEGTQATMGEVLGFEANPGAAGRRLLRVLTREKILRVVVQGSGRRPTTLAFSTLLNIAEGEPVF